MCTCTRVNVCTLDFTHCILAKDMAKYGVFVQHVLTFWIHSVCGVICTTVDFVGVSMYMTL